MNTHDKHREIAEKIVPAYLYHQNNLVLVDYITDALDLAYERGVRESAEKAVQWACGSFMRHERDRLRRFVLSLLAPKVPVWCEHIIWRDGAWHNADTVHGANHWTCCPICKADKPQGTK